ncbi:hypothetical protein ACFQ07_32600 [Actinomadura adrarensis]|uniref:DUF2339 domain-containing protein n=1 Tax=Actinomadura adrarensis TaxID=1819600 RepID=A0ABW3CTV4_9ACTN
MPLQRFARLGVDPSEPVPAAVNWALAGIAVLIAGHVFAWIHPPQGFTDVFHTVWGLAYIWLALLLRRPRPWARAWLTGLLAVQLTGRFVVFALNDGEVLLRTLVVIGAVVTVAVVALLWFPHSSRRYFEHPGSRRPGR